MIPFIGLNVGGAKPLRAKRSSFSRKVAGFTLADGSTWGIVAGDKMALTIVSRLAEVMQLRSQDAPAYRLLVLTDGNGAYANSTYVDHRRQVPVPWIFLPPVNNTFTCIVHPARNNDMLANQLMQLSLVIARQAQSRGGFLLHGALAARDGWGMMLAGPGGVGKTTASRRLTSPWLSLSDDEVLVVCDKNGSYWAHPWPTWSDLMSGGKGGTWDVNHAVPLKGIFFLEQAQEDSLEPLGAGKTACLLVESSQQASWPLSNSLRNEEARSFHLQRFENICSLVKSMTCYRLHLSLDGAFWEEIERVITVQGYNST